jgi:hypothetical protein
LALRAKQLLDDAINHAGMTDAVINAPGRWALLAVIDCPPGDGAWLAPPSLTDAEHRWGKWFSLQWYRQTAAGRVGSCLLFQSLGYEQQVWVCCMVYCYMVRQSSFFKSSWLRVDVTKTV